MTSEFKKITSTRETRYVLETTSAGATGSAVIASTEKPLGEIQKRQTVSVPVNQKPRQGPPRTQTGGGAHRDKKKEQKQGKEKHRKPFAEQGVAEAAKWRDDDREGKTWRSPDWNDGDLSPSKIKIDRSGKDVDDSGDELTSRPGMWRGKADMAKRMTKKGVPTKSELAFQNNLKMRMRMKKKEGGLTGPKGVLPEQGVAEGTDGVSFKKNLLNILQQKYPDAEFSILSDRVLSKDSELTVIADEAEEGNYVGVYMWDVNTGSYRGALLLAIKQTTEQLLKNNPGKEPALFIGGDNENPEAWENIAKKLGYKLITDEDEIDEQGVAEGSGKNVVKSVKVGNFRHDLVDTGMGWQVRIYNGDELYDTGLSKNSEQKGLAALEDAVAYTEKQTRTKRQGVAEGSSDDLVYISVDRVEAFEDWMDSEGLETNVPKTDEGTYVVYDYSNADYRSKMYASDWNEKKGVAEGSEFGAYYYEKVAQEIFNQRQDITSGDEVLNQAYKIVSNDQGQKAARYMFNYDADFPSDVVSAYFHLQKQEGVAEGGLEPDHEISMASNELQSIVSDAKKLLVLIKRYSEMEGLEAWQQSKITKATDYIASVLRSIGGDQGVLEGLKDPKDNPCWKGYKPVGTKQKGGRTVPNCVPKESLELNEYETHTYKDSQGNVWRVDDEGNKELVKSASGGYSSGRSSYGRARPSPGYSRPKGMYFYNVKPGQENDAMQAGLKQSKSGKWYSSYQNSSADKMFGPGRYWEPKNEGMSELDYMESLANSLELALQEKAPEGWEGTVKAMKKHKDIDNPWALAHWMKGQGYKSHKSSKK